MIAITCLHRLPLQINIACRADVWNASECGGQDGAVAMVAADAATPRPCTGWFQRAREEILPLSGRRLPCRAARCPTA